MADDREAETRYRKGGGWKSRGRGREGVGFWLHQQSRRLARGAYGNFSFVSLYKPLQPPCPGIALPFRGGVGLGGDMAVLFKYPTRFALFVRACVRVASLGDQYCNGW